MPSFPSSCPLASAGKRWIQTDSARPTPLSSCALLDRLPTAVLLVDTSGSIHMSNHRASQILGRTPGELVGRDVSEVLVPVEQLSAVVQPDVEDARRNGDTAAPPGGNRPSCSITLADGTTLRIGFIVSDIVLPAFGRATQPGYAVAFQDLTHIEALRVERDRLLQLASVHQLLPTLLHELRNPLAAITNNLELLIEEQADGGLREELHGILHEARRMRLSLEGIGNVGRSLRSNRLQPVDHACSEAFRIMERRARSAGVVARASIETMPLLPFETATVRAIVFNLLNNATQACSAGQGVELRARLLESGSVLELCVADTGQGMAPDVLTRCRDLFFTTKPSGSGVGLALCRSAIAEAGGQLLIDTRMNEGTRVTVRVPVDRTGRNNQGKRS